MTNPDGDMECGDEGSPKRIGGPPPKPSRGGGRTRGGGGGGPVLDDDDGADIASAEGSTAATAPDEDHQQATANDGTDMFSMNRNDDESDSDASSAVSSSLADEIRALTEEEIGAEWLDAARYDDLTILKAIYRVRGRRSGDRPEGSANNNGNSCWIGWSSRDDSGNTALHRAAANGHVDVVKWLLRTHHKEEKMRRRRRNQKENHSDEDNHNQGMPAATMTTTSTTPSVAEYIMLPNESGNTALHWAAANGQAEVVKVLLQWDHESEKSWRRKHETQSTNGDCNAGCEGESGAPVVDVLVKNQFGRSVLTEGFQSDNQDVIQAILEHPSAAEERLLEGGKPTRGAKNTDTSGRIDKDAVIVEDDGNNTTSIIQDLVFGGKYFEDKSVDSSKGDGKIPIPGCVPTDELNVRVREVAMATRSDQLVAEQDRPEHDRTGLSVWSSSIVAAHWMSNIDLEPFLADDTPSTEAATRRRGVVALELGAGCAVPSLVLAQRLSLQGRQSPGSMSHPQHAVYASDWNDEVLDNIRHNFELNDLPGDSGSCDCRAVRMDWNDPSSWEPWVAADESNATTPNDSVRKPSIIVGADLIYQSSMADALVRVIVTLLDRESPHSRFYYVAPTAPRKGGPELIRRLLEEFRLVRSVVAPPPLRRNPLKSQDDDECFLHFQELLTSDFRLYEFAWK